MALDVIIARPGLALPRARWGWLPFVLLNVVGMLAYLHPFFFAETTRPDDRWFEHSADAPLVFGAIGGLCMLLVVADMTNGRLNSKSLAALGVMAAFAAVFRTITLPAGANLFWLLVILGGFAFGPRLGFLLGALALFLSAVVTGGIGPWMPFQMFASAWIGLGAGIVGAIGGVRRAPGPVRMVVLAAYGFAAAILYGAIINLWTWPFWSAGPDISYAPGIGFTEALRRYWNFYIFTSFGWDLLGAVFNVVVLVIIGRPLLRALVRFRERFTWEIEEEGEASSSLDA